MVAQSLIGLNVPSTSSPLTPALLAESGLVAVIGRIEALPIRKRWWRRWVRRSAVAIMLRENDGIAEVLMIKRAEREGDPWSGHMAFPGGRMDAADNNGVATAMRETHEEIGVDLAHHGELVGRLSDIRAASHSRRRVMVVTPYVFRVDKTPAVQLNHEVDEVVWVPLPFLTDRANTQTMLWRRRGIKINLPCYLYRGYRIWGLSLLMLDELLGLRD